MHVRCFLSLTVTCDEFATEAIIRLLRLGAKSGQNRSAGLIVGAAGTARRAGPESGPQKVPGPVPGTTRS